MTAQTLNNIVTGIFVACALAITGMLARREFFPPAPPSSTMTVQSKISNWREFQGGHPIGTPGQPVSLVVFSDYECPACRKFSMRLDTIRAKFPTQLSVYYRNVPIPGHRRARPAAFAAECAARQGRFEHAYKMLFAHVDSIGVRPWGRFATLAGIRDTLGFSECVRDSLPGAVVLRDEADAGRLNVQVTPTLLLNDILISGAPATPELETLIRNAIRAKPASR